MASGNDFTLVKIGDYNLPIPSTYSAISSTIVDNARNIKGEMIGTIVREELAKIELTWRFLTASEWSTILKLFNNNLGGNFIQNVYFYNQTTANFQTKRMYVSDRKSGMWRVDSDTKEILGWTECSLSLVEV